MYETGKSGVSLSLSNNSERDTILRALRASGEFEIIEENSVITIYSRKVPTKQRFRLSKRGCTKKQSVRRLLTLKPKKRVSILERVAKSQDITLASSDSLGAFCSGIIF